jgi:hypothetical protein
LENFEKLAGNEAAALFRDELGKYVNRYRPTKNDLEWLRVNMLAEDDSPSCPSKKNGYVPPLSWNSFAELCQEPGRFLGDLGWQVAAEFFNLGVTFWTLSLGSEYIMFNRRLIPSFGSAVYDVNIIEKETINGRGKLVVVVRWGDAQPASRLLPVARTGVLAANDKAKQWQSYMVERRTRRKTSSATPPITVLNAYVNMQAIVWGKLVVTPHTCTAAATISCYVEIRLHENEDMIEVSIVDGGVPDKQESDSYYSLDYDCSSSEDSGGAPSQSASAGCRCGAALRMLQAAGCLLPPLPPTPASLCLHHYYRYCWSRCWSSWW